MKRKNIASALILALLFSIGVQAQQPNVTVATSTGNGTADTGTIRAAIASNNTPFPVKVDQTTPGTTNAIEIVPDTAGAVAVTTAYTSTLAATVFAVKASAGNLYGYDIHNPAAAPCFIQFWDTASGSVSVGSTAPIMVIGIPTVNRANLMSPIPIRNFTTAISVAATTTATGATPCATVNVANFFYK